MRRTDVVLGLFMFVGVGCGGSDDPSPGGSPDAGTDSPAVDAGVDTGTDTGHAEACVPNCAGRECGDDGCDSTCGTCTGGKVCNSTGKCDVDCSSSTDGTACGVGKICHGGTCSQSVCGDGFRDTALGEECDDGNAVAGDGCDPPSCTFTCKASSDCEDDGNPCNGVAGCDLGTHTCSDSDPLAEGEDCVTTGGEPGTCQMAGSVLGCEEIVCGDGDVQGAEQCDDGNTTDGDGCDSDCTHTEILAVAASYQNTCVLIEGGRVRCWGHNNVGQLGYGHTEDIGDDEVPASAGDVHLSKPVSSLSMGDSHTCVLQEGGSVKCWGSGSSGQLGYANTNNVGDDEFPINLPDVNVGGEVVQVTAGGSHTCARLLNGKVRCWGAGGPGQLGYGNTNTIGDNEHPASAGDVLLGAAAKSLSAGIGHTCAITAADAVRCWGGAFSGQLGYGNSNTIGDNEHPSTVGDVSLIPQGLPSTLRVTKVAASLFSCALFEDGHVLCWGQNLFGQLGQGHTNNIGDDEYPSTQPPIELPGPATDVSVGDNHACALLASGEGVCWGLNAYGQLGYGHKDNVGDDEKPSSVGVIALGAPAKQLKAGGNSTCALLETNEVYCWGANFDGELGYGHKNPIGDDEAPTSSGPVQIF
jgi:cysteine-rich repeat protein